MKYTSGNVTRAICLALIFKIFSNRVKQGWKDTYGSKFIYKPVGLRSNFFSLIE